MNATGTQPTTPEPFHVETVEELARRWRLSRTRIYQLMDEGLPSRKIGRSRRFVSTEADRWLLARPS